MDSSTISFTAYYTNHVWYRNGLAPADFTSLKGRSIYYAVAPINAMLKAISGANIDTYLLQRHYLIDHLLEQYMGKHPGCQILELACGLSARGQRVMRQGRAEGIDYIEADLPEMAKTKTRLLNSMGALDKQHRVVACDFLVDDASPLSLASVLKTLDPNRPVIVVTEGLINYFDLTTLSKVLGHLVTLLEAFPSASYLTDLYPDLQDHPSYPVVKFAAAVIAKLTRSAMSLHYAIHSAIAKGMQGMGFKNVEVHDPQDFYAVLPIPTPPRPPIVRVVEAQV